jgi:spermidine synthase
MKKNILLTSVFLCGACGMVMELVGLRILAPFFGSSITIWSGVVGVILGAMAIGYWFGGKLADKDANLTTLSLIIAFSGISIAIMGAIKSLVLAFFSVLVTSVALGGFMATVFLFVVPSLLLAMVSPYAFKLSLDSSEKLGRTAGNIYAVGTLGSILGTFLAGFWLVPRFGNTAIIISISMILIALSFVVCVEKLREVRVAIAVAALVCAFMTPGISSVFAEVIEEKDTLYGTVIVIELEDRRILQQGLGAQSTMFLDSDELVNAYTKTYDLAMFFNPNVQRILMIGGAGYSYPKYFLERYPDKKIDVVEISPEITEIARRHFRLEDNPRMNIYHQDGRVFLNRNETVYDAILGDAYLSIEPPVHLVTLEATQRVYDSLSDDGVFVANVIGALEGENSVFFRAYLNTVRQVFPQVLVFVPAYIDGVEDVNFTAVQNITIAALKQFTDNLVSDDSYMQFLLNSIYNGSLQSDIVLTDEHAPVEFLSIRRGMAF